MKHRWLEIVCAAVLFCPVFPTLLIAQTAQTAQTEQAPGPYARIAILRPLDGHTVELEAGYIRHLEWHRQAKDTWAWYGWTIWAGERQRWFVYATFGHSAAGLDSPVSPAEDERDNIPNVTPHAQFLGSALYEYLPGLSRGTGEPQPTARLELTTVDLMAGAEKTFEAALSADQARLQGETLWYRMVAGGTAPRYVRLRPRPSLSAILDGRSEQALPDAVNPLIAKTTVEILNLRPTMSYGLSPLRE
jgi:acetyl esterase/lipase